MGKLDTLNSLLHKLGFELNRYNISQNNLLRRAAVLKKYNIELIIDVGANTGIFGNEIRHAGYKGRIVSFEPLGNAYEKLAKNAARDGRWQTYNFALGSEASRQSINISANSHSSSMLDILETHIQAEASASYIGKEDIEIKTLDSVFDEIKQASQEIYLKIDTQGFELSVLKGAERSLTQINTIQLEMSLLPLYKGQALYTDILDFLHSRGYSLIDVDPGFADLKTGTLLQFDGVFHKTSKA